MSKGRAFFSTLPGVVSGVAAFVTAIVGLITVAVQLGWVGDDDGGGASTTVTTGAGGGAGGTGSGGGGGGASTTVVGTGQLSVTPTRLAFAPLQAKEATVTVRNDGNGSVTLQPPTLEGPDRAQFSAAYSGCPTTLAPGRSCPVRVTFSPTRAGRYQATLVVAPTQGTARAVEVGIEGNHIL